MTRFRHRGVVEGFYGPPWSHEDRCALVEWIGDWGMNRFVYAPKDDPLHRESWRDAYPGDTIRALCSTRCAMARVLALQPVLRCVHHSPIGDCSRRSSHGSNLTGARHDASRSL